MLVPGRDLTFRAFFLALAAEWRRDAVSEVAGSVTFFSLLALFPFLLFLVSLASLVIDPASAEALVRELARVAPAAVTEILGDQIRALGERRSTGLLTVSAITTVWAASGGVASLIAALNTTSGVKESRPFWRVRGLSVLVTLGGAVFVVAASALAVATPAVATWLGEPVGTVLRLFRLPVAALLMMLVWAFLYYLLPDRKQPFRLITPGSVVGVLLWALASWGFSIYVARFGRYDAVYGALGGVVVLLFWMWISTQVVLLGAEINAILLPVPERAREAPPVAASLPVEAPAAVLLPVEAPTAELLPAPAARRRSRRAPLLLAAAALGFVAGLGARARRG